MRVKKWLSVYRWWQGIFGGVLLLAVLAEVDPPHSRAAFRANRDGTRTPRRSKNTAAPPAAAKAPPAPQLSSSVSPDHDMPVVPAKVAAVPPYGVSAAAFPWNQPGFIDYNEPPRKPRNASIAEPNNYSLKITPLPPAPAAAPEETAVLIAHLPAQATFWVEGTQTRATGPTRFYQSPPLLPGRKYAYRVRALWLENGQLVSQTRTVPVQAGWIQAIYLRPLPAARPR